MNLVGYKRYFGFTCGDSECFLGIFLVCYLRWFDLGKSRLFGSTEPKTAKYGHVNVESVRLFVKVRKGHKGSFIASVPLKRLEKLSGYDKKRWEFKDGWLILEAF